MAYEPKDVDIIDPAPPRIRILSIDGGGIYGLASAIWLRRLCEAEPRFLDGDDVQLFAGTSSGAINCLLLARHERPREALLAGELERFWRDPRPFRNSDPLSAWWSLFGVTGWFSSGDFLSLLRDVFGDTRLGELKQDVLISTFSWQGSDRLSRTRAGQSTRHWKPKFWGNIQEDDADAGAKIVDIAYAAAAPPTLRPIFAGLGDGATFSASPAIEAVAAVLRHCAVRTEKGQHVLHVQRRQGGVEEEPEGHTDEQVGAILDRISVLSVGSGQQLPALGPGNINAGFLFSQLPTNVHTGDYWPTGAYSLDPSTEAAEFILKRLIGPDRALRLNPPVLHVPTVMAAMLARSPFLWHGLLQHIETGAGGDASNGALAATLEFLRAPQSWDIGGALNLDLSGQAEQRSLRAAGKPALAVRGGTLIIAYASPPPHRRILVSRSRDGGATWDEPTVARGELAGVLRADPFAVPPDDEPEVGAAAPAARPARSDLGPYPEAPIPALQVHDGAFWLALCAGEEILVSRSEDAVSWTVHASIPAGGPAGNPAMASDGERLLLVWLAGGQLCRASFEKGAAGWSTPKAIHLRDDAKVIADPSLAAGHDGFVMAWRGAEERTIWVARSRSGKSWCRPRELPAFVILEHSPALTYAQGVYRMAWRREAFPPNIWVSSAGNGLDWSTPVKLHDKASRYSPALAAQDDDVFMAWVGLGRGEGIWTARRRPTAR